MGRTVVNTQPARETHSTLEVITLFQALMARQRTDRIFNTLRNLRQGLTGFDVLLRILTDLTVDFGTLAVLLEPIIVHAVEIPLLLIGSAIGILILVFFNLALGELVVGEEIRDGNPGRRALHFRTALLLLGLALFLLLSGYGAGQVVSAGFQEARASNWDCSVPPVAPASGAAFPSSLSSSESSSASPDAVWPAAGASALALPLWPFTG